MIPPWLIDWLAERVAAGASIEFWSTWDGRWVARLHEGDTRVSVEQAELPAAVEHLRLGYRRETRRVA